MGNVTFFLEHEEGHLLPTFQLAKRLTERGHQVSYIGLADAADLIERQGYPFLPILEHLFPKGSTRTLRHKFEAMEAETEGTPTGYMGANHVVDSYAGSLVRGEDLHNAVQALGTDLFIASSVFVLHPVVLKFRFNLPVVLLTTWLRSFPKTQYAQLLESVCLHLRGST
jgi:hypothetical protein